MKSNPARSAALIIFALVMTAAGDSRVFADTISLRPVAYTQSETFYAGDDYGNYTINLASEVASVQNYNCGGVVNPASCYETHYINNSNDIFTTTPPPLWADPHPISDSGPCETTEPGFDVYRSLGCGDDMLFAGEYTSPGGSVLRGIFNGANADPVLDYLGSGSIDGGFMSPNGNAYFIDGLNNTLDVALNLSQAPVPEPGSLILLGTGALALSGFVRRKISRRG